jgi:branched-chain amino acid transport system ATP-binding protein
MSADNTRVPRLAVASASLGYGKAVVAHDLDLEVMPGEVVAITGPNGAGKTSLLRAVVGSEGCAVRSGTISLDGRPLGRIRPEKAAAMGIAYVPQGRALFPYTTGAMNLWSGGYPRSDRAAVNREVDRFIETWPIAQRVAKRLAVGMSGGEQQVIALGRGLMAAPRLLLIDEPSLGLAPVIVKQVAELITSYSRDLSEHGVAIVLVEQNVELALEVADRVFVMSAGKLVREWARGEATADEVGQFYMH